MKDPLTKKTQFYSDYEIEEFSDSKIPAFLYVIYLLTTLIGLFCLYYFWDGSQGVFDKGAWKHLEKAAKTTFEN